MLIMFQHRGCLFYSDTSEAHSIWHCRCSFYFATQDACFFTPGILILFWHRGCSFYSNTMDACHTYFNTADACSIPKPRMLVAFWHWRCFLYVLQHHGCFFYSDTADTCSIQTRPLVQRQHGGCSWVWQAFKKKHLNNFDLEKHKLQTVHAK